MRLSRREIVVWPMAAGMGLAAGLFALALSVSSCHPDGDSAMKAIRMSGERWVLAGEYVTPRSKPAPPKEDWVSTLDVASGTISHLVRIPMATPDGERVLFPRVAYNDARKVLICDWDAGHDDTLYDDVWRYDLATGQSRWIAKARWDTVRGFAWSPDGSRVAFIASTRGSPAAVVMQYDVEADRLEEVSGDAVGNLGGDRCWREGDSPNRQRRPVYSEDGNWLYYVSLDQDVMRVDLRTKQCQRLPFPNAFAVLTVKGEYLVYAREVTKGSDERIQIVKVRLDAADDSGAQQVYATRSWLCWNFVSPSRRFVLFTLRYGYTWEVQLLDVDSGTTCNVGRIYGRDFTPHSTAFVRCDDR